MRAQDVPPSYEDRYCAFIDFLGFASAVERGVWSPAQIVSAMRKAARVSSGDEDLIKVTQFSDSVVLSAPASEAWAFVTIVSTSFFLAIELVNNEVLLRGAITRGKLYHQDSWAFGPAFIRAHRLEQAANTPRIIIDTGIAERATWPESMSKREIKGMLNIDLPKDFDGWRYVGYFSPQHMNEFDQGSEGLKLHYSKLRALVAKHKSSRDPSIRSKYGWIDTKLSAVIDHVL